MRYVRIRSGNDCHVDLGSCLAEAISTEVVLAVIIPCHHLTVRFTLMQV